ncbi:MAG: alpha/beta hydrolase [Rhizobiaceae bacterium]
MFLFAAFLFVLIACFVWTNMQVRAIGERYPPVGSIIGAEGDRLHFADMQLAPGKTGPTLLFLHGASGNLRDQMLPFAPALQDKARLIFVDRPGHGYSDRAGAETPAQQAERYRILLDELGVEQATIVGHSLGAASAAAFAVLFPERTKGLVLLAPATHSWPTGVSWYYSLAAMPIIGNLFTETLLLPAGLQTLPSSIKSVFEPQLPPKDYVDRAAIPLAFIPKTFRSNARDVAGLNEFVATFSSRYKEISAPTVVITGDADDIVAPSIHSVGLERDITGAELIIIEGLGHKPEYEATQAAVDAILKVSN